MAASALQFLLQKLDSLIVKEEQLLEGVDTGVKDIRGELESIKSYLRDTDTKEQKDGMQTWVGQLREVAYDIEDVLDEFTLHFGQPPGHGLVRFLCKFQHLKTRHRIATAIQEIKNQIYNISQRKNMYSVHSNDEGSSSNAAIDRSHDRHVESLFIEEAELVGIDEPREELIGWLVKGELKLKVISVVGMGGLGKTTLVRKVYDNERVKGWFNCHAWITVTQSFTNSELLRSIMTQFFREWIQPLPDRIDTMEEIHLIEVLRHFLQDKTYVVVFDDVWHIHAWNCLKYALPDNNSGSRILITTRIGDVGVSCLESPGHVYNLQPLSSAKAWSLFCKKAFRSIPGEVCPPELEELAHNIVKICDGLPLAVVTIGGLLSKKETVLEWKRLHDNLHSELANNPKLQPIKRILSLSYSDLPHCLKSCFLYFSIFPRDFSVKRITLIRLWMAEGFIESEKGETMEKVAEDYLKDLIDRSMVQVAEYYDYGRVRSCRVHDLIREIIVFKSKVENFSTSLIRRNTQMHGKIRRLSIHNNGDDDLGKISLSHLRALFMFGPNTLSLSSMHAFFSGFRLLKVLDLEGAPVERLPVEFEKLLHLKYLSLRNTRISKLPKSLGKLKNLETLDLKGTYVSELPTTILKLQNLRHLLAYHYFTGRHPPFYHTHGVKVPQGIGNLRELQKLSYLEANQDSSVISELGHLAQLKRLGIVKLRREDGEKLCISIEKMKHLCSLSVESINMEELLDLNYLSSPPPCLQRLYLRGHLKTLPDWIASLNNLVRMRLRGCRLKEDSLAVLQALPNLVELTLIRAYDGVRLYCGSEGFHKLKILDLEQLDSLDYVIFDRAMPSLRKMYIRRCVQLKVVPLGIEELKNLKELHLFDMPEVFVQTLRRHGGTDHLKVKHIPIVRCYASQLEVYEEL